MYMWEQAKRVIFENAREVCGSVKLGGKNPKSVWWNNEVKTTVRRKEATWKDVLPARSEEAKERF